MAEYYPLVKRAIEALGPDAPGESRRGLYIRARDALVAQLRNVQPPLTASEITRERLSLEEAIREVEGEAAQRARANSKRPDIVSADNERRIEEMLQSLMRVDQLYPRKKGAQATLVRSQPRPTALPPITAIPDQNNKAITFRPSRRGPLELLPDPPRDPHDPEQSHLYLRIRQQLNKLKEDIPNQERAQINHAIDDFLDQPATWSQVEFKKVLWLCGNSLRNSLAQHDAVKDSTEPHYAKLPPIVAEALRRPVEAWNVFVLGDPDLVELDAKRVGPQEHASLLANIVAAKPIVENAAADRGVTTEQTGEVLSASLQTTAAPADNINAKQAHDLVAGTSKNLIIQLLRRAYLTCQSLADPQTDEDRTLVAEYQKGIARGAGAAAVGGVVAATTFAAPYALSFIEFVVHNAPALREYIAVAFQNPQLAQVIDAIEHVRARLASHAPQKPD